MTRTSTAISRSRRSSSAATSPAWFPAVAPFTFFVNNGAGRRSRSSPNGVQITSIGDKVVWEQHGPNEIWGVTVPDG